MLPSPSPVDRCTRAGCRAPAGWPRDLEHLPGTPWSLRLAGAPDGRPALEVYDAGVLVDVMVARTLAPQALRGARSAVWAGEQRALAWGCLPDRDVRNGTPAGTGLQVTFRRGRVRPRLNLPEVTTIADSFWIALADGRFGRVKVTHGGGQQRAGLRTVRSC